MQTQNQQYKAYFVPWIVNGEGWRGGIALRNIDDSPTVVKVTEYNIDGMALVSYNRGIAGNGTVKWTAHDLTRSILIETQNTVFVTAHQWLDPSGVTQLQVHDITLLKK